MNSETDFKYGNIDRFPDSEDSTINFFNNNLSSKNLK